MSLPGSVVGCSVIVSFHGHTHFFILDFCNNTLVSGNAKGFSSRKHNRSVFKIYMDNVSGGAKTSCIKIDNALVTFKPLVSLCILTHASNAKCFRNVTLINIRGLAVITVPFRGYDRNSPNWVVIKRE